MFPTREDDDKTFSLRRQAWDPKHPAQELTWLGEQGWALQPWPHRGQPWPPVLVRAETLMTAVWLMQTVLGNAQGKPWPTLITLGRGIILLVNTIRLCQKETSSTFATVNICWKALKHYLIKLCLTMNNAPLSCSFHPIACTMLIRVLLSHQSLWGWGYFIC